MQNGNDPKSAKKAAKAQAKIEKAKAKASARIAETQSASGLPDGVGVSIQKADHGSNLIVTGLKEDQLRRVLPHVTKEVLISLEADRSAFRAGLKTFLRDGVLQALIKVIAGLIVGLLLFQFGLG